MSSRHRHCFLTFSFILAFFRFVLALIWLAAAIGKANTNNFRVKIVVACANGIAFAKAGDNRASRKLCNELAPACVFSLALHPKAIV